MPTAAFGPRLPLAVRQTMLHAGRARTFHSVRPVSGPYSGRRATGCPCPRALSLCAASGGDGEQQGEQQQYHNAQHWVPSFAPDPALRPPDLAGTVSLLSTSVLPSRGGGGTVYPSSPRAAVAITICTRPAAFDKPSATRYLLVQRGKDPGKGKWSLPGGSVELGEDLLEAAAREAREETNIDRDALQLYHSTICTTDAIYRDDTPPDGVLGKVKFHYVISHVAAWVNAGEVTRAQAGDDATALQWVTMDELKRLANSDVLVGPVLDVVFRVEKFVRLGMINLDRDLVVLPPK